MRDEIEDKKTDGYISFKSSEEFIKYFEDRRNSRSIYRKIFDYFYYPMWRIWEDWNPKMLCKRIRWLLQRIFRGFDDTISWNLDHKIAEWILPRLKHFRSVDRMGVPCTMFTEEEHINENSTEEDHKKKLDEWNIIIDKMILAFENIVEEYYEYNKDTMAQKQKEIEEGLQLFSKFFRGLWD